MLLIEILRGSKELKRLIVNRSFEYKIPLRYICQECGIEYKEFMLSYINSSTMKDCRLKEEDFANILKLLGVTIKHQFIIDKEYDGLEVRNELINKHG